MQLYSPVPKLVGISRFVRSDGRSGRDRDKSKSEVNDFTVLCLSWIENILCGFARFGELANAG